MEGVGGGGHCSRESFLLKYFLQRGVIIWVKRLIEGRLFNENLYIWLTHDLHHVSVYFIIIVTVHLFLIELYSNRQKQKSLQWFPVYSHIWNERSWEIL